MTAWSPLIVNVALTGMVPTKADNPAVPITPAEIVEDAERCVQAGASIVHVHARDEDGAPTWRAEVYAEIVGGIRERCPAVIVCVSTSGRMWSELESAPRCSTSRASFGPTSRRSRWARSTSRSRPP